MTEPETSELASLLDDVRRELGNAVDELDRSRDAHRTVESLLLAVLEHVPMPIVVVDDQLRVRASSSSAEAEWGATVGAPLSSLEGLDEAGVVEACRTAAEEGHVAAGSMPDGYQASVLDEPGTGARYVVVWPGR